MHSLFEVKEQEITEPSVEPVQEGDFLAGYEIKNWQMGPRIYKILAASAVANLLALVIFSQTSVLTMKGCDSPVVGSVCKVLDTVYLGAMLWGTDREFIDADYTRTELENADITFVEVAPESSKLDYPEGYFALANPVEWAEKVAAANQPLEAGFLAPGIPANPTPTTIQPYQSGNSLIDTPAKPPTRNDSVVTGDLPTGFDNPTTSTPGGMNRKRRGPGFGQTAKATPEATPDEGTTAKADEPKVDPTAPIENTVTINKAPLRVYGSEVAQQLEKKEIDLAAPFKVTAIAELLPDGRMDTSIDRKTKQPRSRIMAAEGDEKMVETVKKAIAAISDSGWLGYLSQPSINIKKIRFEFSQDNEKLLVRIFADQATNERAMTLSGQLSGLLTAGKIGKEALGDPDDADVLTLLRSAQANAEGKQVVINFLLPKDVAQEMINRNIKNARESEANRIKQKEGQVLGGQPSNSTARR